LAAWPGDISDAASDIDAAPPALAGRAIRHHSAAVAQTGGRIDVLKRQVRLHLRKATPDQAIFASLLTRMPRLSI
jgi:hypothetical protein